MAGERQPSSSQTLTRSTEENKKDNHTCRPEALHTRKACGCTYSHRIGAKKDWPRGQVSGGAKSHHVNSVRRFEQGEGDAVARQKPLWASRCPDPGGWGGTGLPSRTCICRKQLLKEVASPGRRGLE